MTEGWFDVKTGEACVVVRGPCSAGFCGTLEEFLERCRRMDEAAALRRHGWDANGSPVEPSDD